MLWLENLFPLVPLRHEAPFCFDTDISNLAPSGLCPLLAVNCVC